jgi:TfoX N-terminal domain
MLDYDGTGLMLIWVRRPAGWPNDDGNVQITSRDLRDRSPFVGQGNLFVSTLLCPSRIGAPARTEVTRMVASDSFAEFLGEQLALLGRVTMRRMFDKTGVFCDGLMFGMVTDNTLYFRVNDGNRTAFKCRSMDLT